MLSPLTARLVLPMPLAPQSDNYFTCCKGPQDGIAASMAELDLPKASSENTEDHHQNAGSPVVRTVIAENLRHSTWLSKKIRFPPAGSLPFKCGLECGLAGSIPTIPL